MAKSYPEAIPAEFAKHDDLQSAYRRGWNHGHGIACHNVPKLGAKIRTDGLGRVVVDAENIREVHESLCYSAEENSRQFSPFEFTAHEFNSADGDIEIGQGDDGLWFVSNEAGPLGQEFASEELAQAWIDAQPTSEELWEAFEVGINDAVGADLAEYTDEDYGIPADSDEMVSCEEC